MHSLRNRTEKLIKGSLFYLFLKLGQINYILSNIVSICYTFWYIHIQYTYIIRKHKNHLYELYKQVGERVFAELLCSVSQRVHTYIVGKYIVIVSFFFFNNVIYFIQMLATINTPKVQAPFGVSLLHLVLIIQGYNQNYLLSFLIDA